MSHFTDLEERFFNSNFIKGNDDYITDGLILLTKKYLTNEFLKSLNNDVNNDIDKVMSTVSYDKGEDIDLTSIGKCCELLESGVVGVVIDDKYSLDYNHLKIVMEHYKWDFPYFTKSTKGNDTIIKFWGADNEFLGCFLSMKDLKGGNND